MTYTINGKETHTINGKQWTEFDINRRCAVLTLKYIGQLYENEKLIGADRLEYNPCNNWNDAGSIIDKCFDELMSAPNDWSEPYDGNKWELIIDTRKCTKQAAACICYIELNEEAGI